MAKSTTRTRRVLQTLVASGFALGVAVAGCGNQHSSQETFATTDSAILVCGSHQVANYPAGPTHPEYEFYVLPAIQNKLKHYPALASEYGRTSVSTCDEARSFMSAFHSFRQSHPAFDAHEALDLPHVTPPRPPGFTPDLQITKLLNAQVESNSPVVRLCSNRGTTARCDPNDPANAGDLCTGTFIAKNWIATAAHCMGFGLGLDIFNPEAGGVPLPDGGFEIVPSGAWHGWYPWTIAWTDGSGSPIPPGATLPDNGSVAAELTTLALQYPDDRWMGSTGLTTQDNAAYDFALLYLPTDENDHLLPPNADNGSAMRESRRTPDPTELTAWYGAGPTSNTLMGAFTPTIQVDSDGLTISSIANTGDPLGCEGDSGGPIVRAVSISGGGSFQVLEATLSGTSSKDISGCATVGATTYWVRTDAESDFIDKSVAEQGGVCELFPSTNFSLDYAKCWGDPCQADMDCPSGQSCRGSGTIGVQVIPPCPVCGSTAPACGCVQGQCLPTLNQ